MLNFEMELVNLKMVVELYRFSHNYFPSPELNTMYCNLVDIVKPIGVPARCTSNHHNAIGF